MTYYNDPQNVEQYIKMAEGYDGKALVDVLRNHLPDGATVLELGIGPGKDFQLLSEHYQVIGSDYSAVFVERFQKQYPEADVILLDAVTMDFDRTVDCIYSNKVLYHLTKDNLRQSFQKQAAVLNPGGVLFHSFWYGDEEDSLHGLRFVYYTEDTLKALIGDEYSVVEMQRYTEMETDDSFYVILKKAL